MPLLIGNRNISWKNFFSFLPVPLFSFSSLFFLCVCVGFFCVCVFVLFLFSVCLVLYLNWHLESSPSTCIIFLYNQRHAFVPGKISYIIKSYLSWASPALHCISAFSGVNVSCKRCSRQLKDTSPFSALYSPAYISSAFWFPSSLLNKDILRTVQYCCLLDTAQN